MPTGFESDQLFIAKAQVQVLRELTEAVKQLVKELHTHNDREESQVKY